MRRRHFITLAGSAGVAWSLTARAQQAKPRIGVLLVGGREPFWSHFRDGLRDVGYIAGENILIDFRSAEGKLSNLPGLAAELTQSKVDVIVASETPAVQAAKQATAEIPIVMAPAGDPVATGLISSLAQPGGNVTGLSAATAEIAGKSLRTYPRDHSFREACSGTSRSHKPVFEAFPGANRAICPQYRSRVSTHNGARA